MRIEAGEICNEEHVSPLRELSQQQIPRYARDDTRAGAATSKGTGKNACAAEGGPQARQACGGWGSAVRWRAIDS